MGGFCLVVIVFLILFIQPKMRLTITYGVCISINGAVSRGRDYYHRGYLSSFYEMTREALLIPGLFLHAMERLDIISTAVRVVAVIFFRAWYRPYTSLGVCKGRVLMLYVWRVEANYNQPLI